MIVKCASREHIGKNLFMYDSLDSTNSHLKAHIQDYPDGSAVIARHQTAGKGRGDHKWLSDEGMLSLSILMKRKTLSPQITITAAVAVKQALDQLYGINSSIKWTNDILVNDLKVCGILCESSIVEYDTLAAIICGIGINVGTPKEFFFHNSLPYASSLKEITGKTFDTADVANAVLDKLDALSVRSFPDILESYRSGCMNIGRKVTFTQNDKHIYAIAENISENGELLCRTADSRLFVVNAGEVKVDGIYGCKL